MGLICLCETGYLVKLKHYQLEKPPGHRGGVCVYHIVYIQLCTLYGVCNIVSVFHIAYLYYIVFITCEDR